MKYAFISSFVVKYVRLLKRCYIMHFTYAVRRMYIILFITTTSSSSSGGGGSSSSSSSNSSSSSSSRRNCSNISVGLCGYETCSPSRNE